MIVVAVTKEEARRLQVFITGALQQTSVDPETEALLRRIGIMCNQPDIDPMEWVKTLPSPNRELGSR